MDSNRENTNFSERFKEYYAQYYATVFKRAAYLTGNVQAAEDISQDTFIKLYNSPPEHSNICAWLISVATNMSYNYLRDEKTRQRKEPGAAAGEKGVVISIEDAAVKNSEIRLIKKILNSMDARDRICLLLKFSGYKYNEIAEIAGIERNSVGKILARAQTKFRERYQKEVES